MVFILKVLGQLVVAIICGWLFWHCFKPSTQFLNKDELLREKERRNGESKK